MIVTVNDQISAVAAQNADQVGCINQFVMGPGETRQWRVMQYDDAPHSGTRRLFKRARQSLQLVGAEMTGSNEGARFDR